MSCRKQTDLADLTGIIQLLPTSQFLRSTTTRNIFIKRFGFLLRVLLIGLSPILNPMEKDVQLELPPRLQIFLAFSPVFPLVVLSCFCCSSLSPTLYFSTHNYPINAGLMPLGTRIEFGVGLGFVDQHTFPYLAHQRASEGSQY